MRLDFYSSAFCGPCHQTRRVLDEAARLVPLLSVAEHDVVAEAEAALAAGVRSTPTVVVTDARGQEVFRAEGAPTLNQVLAAVARAL